MSDVVAWSPYLDRYPLEIRGVAIPSAFGSILPIEMEILPLVEGQPITVLFDESRQVAGAFACHRHTGKRSRQVGQASFRFWSFMILMVGRGGEFAHEHKSAQRLARFVLVGSKGLVKQRSAAIHYIRTFAIFADAASASR